MARRHYHPKTGEFGDYMQHKREKLRLQQHYGDTDDAIFIGSEESDSPKKKLFYGVVYYSTGINHITEIELRKLVIENGGMHETYNTPLVTHFVAKHLSEAKASELRGLKRHNFFVVRSEWFTDSLAANRRLPEHKYSLDCMDMRVVGQKDIASMLQKNDSPSRSLHENSARANGGKALRSIGNRESPPRKSSKTSEEDVNFVQNFFENSRLHHIGSFRKHLRVYTKGLRDRAESMKENDKKKMGSLPIMKSQRRFIAHIDMDCFFASVALLKRPDLRNKPVAVAHGSPSEANGSYNQNNRSFYSTSEVSSCNYVARDYGVRNGSFMGEARTKCPHLIVLPYEFSEYTRISEIVYGIIFDYTPDVEVVSCDESYVDITGVILRRFYESTGNRPLAVFDNKNLSGIASLLAKEIRAKILEATGCTASAGVARNKILAKLATSHAKKEKGPNSQFLLLAEGESEEAKLVDEFLFKLPIKNMPGLGWRRQKKIQHVKTCGELRHWSENQLKETFGDSVGSTVHNSLRGIGSDEVETSMDPKSVGAEINYGVRFQTEERFFQVMKDLSAHIGEQIEGYAAGNVGVKMKRRDPNAREPGKFLGHGQCINITKSHPLHGNRIFGAEEIYTIVMRLWAKVKFPIAEIRGIGIHLSNIKARGDEKKNHDIRSMWQSSTGGAKVTGSGGAGSLVDSRRSPSKSTGVSDPFVAENPVTINDSSDEAFARMLQVEQEIEFQRRAEQEAADLEMAKSMALRLTSRTVVDREDQQTHANDNKTSESQSKRKRMPAGDNVTSHGNASSVTKQRKISDFVTPNASVRQEMGVHLGLSQAIDETTFQELPMHIRAQVLRDTDSYRKQSAPPSKPQSIAHDVSLPANENSTAVESDESDFLCTISTAENRYKHIRDFFQMDGYEELSVVGTAVEWDRQCRAAFEIFLHSHSCPSDSDLRAVCQCSNFFVVSQRIYILKSLIKCFHVLSRENEELKFWRKPFLVFLLCTQKFMEASYGATMALKPLLDRKTYSGYTKLAGSM